MGIEITGDHRVKVPMRRYERISASYILAQSSFWAVKLVEN
jgi:hypothetical protein